MSALSFRRDWGCLYRVTLSGALVGFVERDPLGQGWWAYTELEPPFRERDLFDTRLEAGVFLAGRTVDAPAVRA